MATIEQLSKNATQGRWVTRTRNKLGSDLYVDNGGSYIASFRSNAELPRPHHEQMLADADLTCALVNAFRSGQLVENTD